MYFIKLISTKQKLTIFIFNLLNLGKASNEVIKEGLGDLAKLCDIIDNKFDDAVAKFEK